MEKRSGPKFGGDHTTFIDLAAVVVDIAVRRPEVVKVSAGFIQTGKGSTGGSQRIKFARMNGGLLLTVRQSRSVQEVRVFTRDAQATIVELARASRNRDISISFDKNHKGA